MIVRYPTKNHLRFFVLLATFSLFSLASHAEEDATEGSLIVNTKTGPISGATSAASDEVMTFKGIPYAAPPIGDLRWKPPQSVEPWTNVRDASNFAPRCTQTDAQGGFYTNNDPQPLGEDCLYLNVWTKSTNPDSKQPVMVWIHGGAFILGSGSDAFYNGTSLAEQDVTLVTINYRLGIFGFLSHPALTAESENGASGNQGLLDQIAALAWIRDNISAFGGDPSNVTIFGESAGSMSVCYLVASPLAKGLFQKAIGQSGGCFNKHASLTEQASAFDPNPDNRSGHEIGMAIAAALGQAEANAESLAALRSLSSEVITETLAETETAVPWRSIFVDGWVFPDQMHTLMLDGRASAVDSIVGSTKDEGTTLFTEIQEIPREQWEAQVKALYADHGDSLIAAYSADADVSTKKAQQEMTSDALFANEMRIWARLVEQQGQNAYVYVFNHAPPMANFGRQLGAFHAAEIPYIFHAGSFDAGEDGVSILYDETDRSTEHLMQSYWVNFAKTGTPNGDGLPQWPRYQAETNLTLGISHEPEVIADFRKQKLDIFEELALKAHVASD